MTPRTTQTSSFLPQLFEPSTFQRAALDERAFRAHRARLTREFGKLMAWILVVATVMFWPTDALIFADRPEMSAFFNFWRVGITALSVLTILGYRFVPLFSRRPEWFLGTILATGAVVCGHAVGTLGEFGEPFYACGYLLCLTTVPIIVGPTARALLNLTVIVAYALPYCLAHPGFVTNSEYAGPTFLFHAFTAIACAGIGHSIYYLIRSNFQQQETLELQADELARAREKSERLLLNILPQTVARQLKDGASTVADAYDDVSVMFVDICGFTALSDGSRAVDIVKMLNRVFSRFDNLVERHGIEKIKTIGDAYMVAGGLPTTTRDHTGAIAELALDILEIAHTFRSPTGHPLAVRIGAAVGPVVAGVIGRKKFIYDLLPA